MKNRARNQDVEDLAYLIIRVHESEAAVKSLLRDARHRWEAEAIMAERRRYNRLRADVDRVTREMANDSIEATR